MQRHVQHQDAIDVAFDARLRRSLQAFRLGQELFQAEIRHFAHWDYDLATCTLVFSAGGRRRVFEFVPIATYVREAKEWLWAWANDSFPELARNCSIRIRGLYSATQYRIFDQPGFAVPESDLEELCALAVDHLGADGLFRADSHGTTLYLAVHTKMKEANKAPDPTPADVTPAADAPGAPPSDVGHR